MILRALILAWVFGAIASAQALEITGQISTRSAWGFVLETELFTETIAEVEIGHKFGFLEGLSFKAKLDPSFDFETGRTRFGLIDRYGVDELYLDYSASNWDVQIGIQKLAWGRGDGVVPNDILNPKDRRRFLADSELQQKIGNFMVRASYYGQSGTVEAVWIPHFEPDRDPIPGDPFFPPTLSVQPSVQLLGFPIPASIVLLDGVRPKTTFNRSELGLRAAATFGPLDSQLYMFFGYDRQAIYSPEIHFFVESTPQNLTLIDLLDAEVRIDVTPRHPPIWQIGSDVTSTVGPVVIRAEAAFLKGRRFNWSQTDGMSDQQLSALIRAADTEFILERGILEIIPPELVSENDSATFLVGVDYPPPALGDWELFTSAQIIQQRIFDIVVPLVFEERETSLTGLVRANRSSGSIEVEAAGTVNLTRQAYLVAVRAAWKWNDSWKLRGAFYSLGGKPGSVLADFQALDLGTVELVYYW